MWEFGNPGPDDQSDVGLYEPIKADPSLAVGWSLLAGAIKPCGVVQNSNCYVGPDGSERLFDQSPGANYFRTSDGSQLLLHSLGGAGFEMWDGDGNRYVFDWHVTGYDDAPQSYLFDLGRGRNGWYLTSLTDPFGNGITLDLLQRPRQREPLLDQPLPDRDQLLDPAHGPARGDDAAHGQSRDRPRCARDHEPGHVDRRGRGRRHDRALVALAGDRRR